MDLTRRDFMKATTAVAGALGLHASGILSIREAYGLEADQGGVPVVWLQAQSCSGCSVSLLNSIYYTTVDDLLINSLDVDYHPTIMAASGEAAVASAEAAYEAGGYVLVLEGSIPIGEHGRYCTLWDGTTALEGVRRFAARAAFVVAVGTCACYGGMPGGWPNPTRARGLGTRFARKNVVNVPGCPAHPDWVVGTIAYIMANGEAPALDAYGRPLEFFEKKIHGDQCPLKRMEEVDFLGQYGCLKELGCKGPKTYGDCQKRLWNSPGANENGVNFCMGAGSPCIGCTEPKFPDGMSPFFK
jgi:NiFe hydrogenase small subunit HydA